MAPDEKKKLLDMAAQLKKMATELTERNAALQVEIIERKRIEKEILEITQIEQRRFSSQLHDGLCQELTGILMFVKGLSQKMERNNKLDVAELNKIAQLLNGAVSQARATARGLYPGELENVSLMHLLEELTSRTQTLSNIACQFHCHKPVYISDNDISTNLYKIAQEGVGNSVRHSQAQLIEVSLENTNGVIVLSVKDDGIGFKQNTQKTDGIGLKIMKYRAHMMDALFQITPNTPHGVILTCTLRKSS